MISKKEVQHIAKLARLDLSQAEIEKYRKELSAI
ncbi:MAG: Asp-tRNA(Asn)/Glu-tRNA(Gln) amidotransferase GatCAB subunit C, partial [Candidatus Nealsonbacteria bacterium CG09_land_8_20_14_0_10_42_14]